MARKSMGTWLVAIVLGAGLTVSLFGQARAQYPPPVGSVALAAGDSTPVVGEDVSVTATIEDENGDPAAEVECTFSIGQQPGSDADVDAGPFTTGANGQVSSSLHTGSAPGTIVVVAECGGLSAQVSVVASAAAPPPSVPGEPPASLPSTGSATEGGGHNWAFWALLAAGVVGLGGLVFGWRRARA